LFALVAVKGVYVKVGPEGRCFSEPVAKKLTLTVNYEAVDGPSQAHCSLSGKAPNGEEVVVDHHLLPGGGSVVVKAVQEGDYNFCFKCDKEGKWEVEFDHLGNKPGVTGGKDVERKLNRLVSLLEGLQLDMDYHKREQDKFTEAGLKASGSIANFSILTLCMILLSALLASRRLGKWVRYTRII
jgi:hypothetical protein